MLSAGTRITAGLASCRAKGDGQHERDFAARSNARSWRKYLVSDHAYQELIEDGILPSVVLDGIASVVPIEDYSDRVRGAAHRTTQKCVDEIDLDINVHVRQRA